MAIYVNEQETLFALQTENTTYQMMVDSYGVLLHTYYGKKIDNEMIDHIIFKSDVGFSGNPVEAQGDRTYSLDCLPQELPSSGVGDYREDMIRLQYEDGTIASDFRYEGYEILPYSYKIPQLPALYDTEVTGQTLIITMREVSRNVKVHLYYGVLEPYNVITRAAVIENVGEEQIVVQKALSCSIDFMYGQFDGIYFQGRHAMERKLERTSIKHYKLMLESKRGTSSHQCNPTFLLCDPHATEDFGDCYGFAFVYSGNFQTTAQKDQRDQTRVTMGIHPDGFSFTLKEGESFYTPQVMMSYSDRGFTMLSKQYHKTIREHICRGAYKKKQRPILINNWEATYFDFNRDKILEIGKQAAELGIEMLVLDDGWFGKRNDDNSGLGDWFVNEEKMGGTLKELGEELEKIGLQFGIWFEPEMISEDSELYKKHPDWAIRVPNREPNRSRNQLVLDMSREDVREYLLERMTDVLSNAPISYVKWDMNRSICDIYSHQLPANRQGELYHRYLLGVYDLLERLLQRFPNLLLEGCSGGGGRFDIGMLYYSPQIWCSDNTDAINRLHIQYGTSFFYPISTMGAHVSAVPNHQTGRTTPFQTRGDVALSGSFGYELDLSTLSEEEKECVKEQVKRYKKYNEWIQDGEYYRLIEVGDDHTAWQFVATDKTKALLTLVKTGSEGNPLPVHVKIKGLDENKKYYCPYNQKVHTGRVWNQIGITLQQIPKEYESIQIEWLEWEDTNGK